MNAWTNFSASETLNMFRSLEMFLRWKNAVFVTLEIWFSKDRLLSNITPCDNDPGSHKEVHKHRSEVGVQKDVYLEQMCK